MRLAGSERAVVEVAAIAEHVASLAAAAAGFQLKADLPDGSPATEGGNAIALLDESTAPEAAPVLGEIRAWAREALGVDRVPDIWRAFAHQPRLLEAVWRKNRLVMTAGVLPELVKNCAALGAAQFWQSPYLIAYQTQFLRKTCGFNDGAIVEVTAMMMHALAFNTIAHGMRLEAPYAGIALGDFEPGGRLESVRGPGR